MGGRRAEGLKTREGNERWIGIGRRKPDLPGLTVEVYKLE